MLFLPGILIFSCLHWDMSGRTKWFEVFRDDDLSVRKIYIRDDGDWVPSEKLGFWIKRGERTERLTEAGDVKDINYDFRIWTPAGGQSDIEIRVSPDGKALRYSFEDTVALCTEGGEAHLKSLDRLIP